MTVLMARAAGVCVVAMSVAAAIAGAQSCPGDLNGDGQVTVAELITAVNSALYGCSGHNTPTPPTPTPTPPPVTGCQLRFDVDYGAGNFCYFSGRFNAGCGSSVPVSFTTIGSFGVFLSLIPSGANCFTGGCFTFLATPTDAHHALLTHWSNDLSDPYFKYDLAGDVTLSADGQTLEVRPNASPFAIGGCAFVDYVGTFQH
jgi:hypothetical protein